MNRCIVVTGSASGIGRATCERLAALGDRVIGIDLRDADFNCDLADATARADLPQRVGALAPCIDGVVAAAGISAGEPATLLAVNFFGATRLLAGLRPLLAKSAAPRALVLSSVASRMPSDASVVEACLSGDEEQACLKIMGSRALPYATSKAALSRWVRRTAIHKDWAGAGILLNAVAPGTVMTPMTQPVFNLPNGRKLLEGVTPTAVGRFGTATEIAELISFLLSPENSFMLGQTVFADGGCDAIQRGDTVW